MMRTVLVVVGALLLGVGAVMAQQEIAVQQDNLMRGQAKSLYTVILKMVKGEIPYNQAAVDTAIKDLEESVPKIAIVNYVVVDDFGKTLNPLLLAGQVHGGAMQGIGQALMEQAVYDPKDGQLVTGTFMDYALPRAADGPSFVFETHNVPCKTNPLGVKGAGEAGAIGSCPAVVNAIIDGLWREYRIDHIDMPATPERVWIAIREHQRRHSL